MRKTSLAWAFLFCFPVFAADSEKRPDSFGAHYGYLFDVREERNKRDIEMVMLERPKDPPPLQEVIFNEKLSKEFQQQYKYRFGESQAEQTLNTVGRQDDYTYFTGRTVTLKEYQNDQQAFAEYMTRRLTEYHVDNWAKNDPDMRPVYEIKDRVSNVNVELDNGYKFEWKYNFAGPSMEAKLKNPYDIEVKTRLEMTGIVSDPKEYIYQLGYQFTPRVHGAWIEKQVDGISQLVFSRRMTSHISASITALVDRSDAGLSSKQELYLVGLSWWD